MDLCNFAASYFFLREDFASFFCKKWSIVGPDQKIAEIQGLLQLALQRSSCESDPYKERLFVYMKGLDIVPPPTSSTGWYFLLWELQPQAHYFFLTFLVVSLLQIIIA